MWIVIGLVAAGVIIMEYYGSKCRDCNEKTCCRDNDDDFDGAAY